jgi:hypothetical protein
MCREPVGWAMCPAHRLFCAVSGMGRISAINLAAYLAAHVLLCLLPAFFIAGAMSALIPKETITRFLGRNSSKTVSYPAAAAAGSLLAVCSCTIVPLFAGIYKKGAGSARRSPSCFSRRRPTSSRWSTPAASSGPTWRRALRAVADLRHRHRADHGAALPRRRRRARRGHRQRLRRAGRGHGRSALVFLFVWVVLLLAGTLKLDVLTGDLAAVRAADGDAPRLAGRLDRLVPYDAPRARRACRCRAWC